jgi:hypothetical protein
MGYIYYVAMINKKDGDILRTKKYNELVNEYGDKDDYVGIYNLPIINLYEFGKYIGFSDEIVEKSECFFLDLDTHKKFNDEHHCYKSNEDIFLIAIEYYRQQTEIWYKELSEMEEKALRGEMLIKCRNWNVSGWILPYNIDKKRKEIVNSWSYEYAIFELVRLYKNIDFENNYLIFYAY